MKWGGAPLVGDIQLAVFQTWKKAVFKHIWADGLVVAVSERKKK
jgi:hypothetical protein